MKLAPTSVFLACALALSDGSAQAARVVFSCDVIQNHSGTSYPETITLDDDTHVITHLKRSWSDGGQPLIGNGRVQFVEITKDRLTWGTRRKADDVIDDLFSVDLGTGRYAWLDTDGTEISHGSCRLPELTS